MEELLKLNGKTNLDYNEQLDTLLDYDSIIGSLPTPWLVFKVPWHGIMICESQILMLTTVKTLYIIRTTIMLVKT